MGKPTSESSRHGIAWELYYALGADRSFGEVARRLNVSVAAVSGWSQAFRWKERISQREKMVAEVLTQKAVEDEAQAKADALKITRASIMRYAQTLSPVRGPDGSIIKPASAEIRAADFVALVKLDQFLRGKAETRSEMMIGGPAFEKLMDSIAAVIEREVTDPALRQRLAAGFTEAAAGLGTTQGNA